MTRVRAVVIRSGAVSRDVLALCSCLVVSAQGEGRSLAGTPEPQASKRCFCPVNATIGRGSSATDLVSPTFASPPR